MSNVAEQITIPFFYNTVGVSGEELAKCIADAAKLEEVVYKLFLHQPGKYCWSDVEALLVNKFSKQYNESSLKRALSNLTNKQKGWLVILKDERVKSKCNATCHPIMLNPDIDHSQNLNNIT